MAGTGSLREAGAEEEYRRRFRDLLRANSGMLMNVLETAAGAEDKGLLRNVVEAAFFIFSGEEESLPGGKDFWTRMRINVSPSGERISPRERSAIWSAVGSFRRELDRYAAGRPDIQNALEDFDRRGRMPSPPPTTAPSILAAPAPAVTGGTGPGPAVKAPPAAMATPLEADRPGTELDLLPTRLPRPPAEAAAPPAAPPFAQVILPPSPAPSGDGGMDDLRARLERSESELGRKESLLKELDGELRRLREQLRSRDEPAGTKALEERLAVQEEETRMARSDLAKLEKKYRENLELLKEEARDRGSLQKHLDNSQAEVARAQERLKEEQEKLADARRRLDKRERELETLEERLHAMQLELVRKEEDIGMAMQHLRDEEGERRRLLDALRQEARDKAQMEHRLKRREEELSRLEVRIVEEEKRIEALKGSQAISEEEALRKAAELRRREEEVRALEAGTQSRLDALRAEEEGIRERVSRLKKDLRDGEVLEAQLKKREELRATLEARYRLKEEELVKELRELERLRAGMEERDGAAGSGQQAAGAPAPPLEAGIPAPVAAPPDAGVPAPSPSRGDDGVQAPGPSTPDEVTDRGHSDAGAPSESNLPPGPVPIMRTLVVAPPPEPQTAEPPDAPTTPARLFPDTERAKDRSRDELLDLLARKKKSK